MLKEIKPESIVHYSDKRLYILEDGKFFIPDATEGTEKEISQEIKDIDKKLASLFDEKHSLHKQLTIIIEQIEKTELKKQLLQNIKETLLVQDNEKVR